MYRWVPNYGSNAFIQFQEGGHFEHMLKKVNSN